MNSSSFYDNFPVFKVHMSYVLELALKLILT